MAGVVELLLRRALTWSSRTTGMNKMMMMMMMNKRLSRDRRAWCADTGLCRCLEKTTAGLEGVDWRRDGWIVWTVSWVLDARGRRRR